ncbi:esterase/lipase family protein [Variovorax sp. RCC_210]|uniref:esterase/lipase family protein n=1 Tax=Variovorax sp. RCC_210 TaxID=3239217 RepID=UPI0035234C3C
MAATLLNGTNQTVSIGPGYALRTPGFTGAAELRAGGTTATTRASVRGLDQGMDALDAALAAADVSQVRLIDLTLKPAAAGGTTGRSAGAAAGDIELEVPDLGDDTGQLVLSVDDAGALHWHLPEPATPTATAPSSGSPSAPSAPVSRGGGGGVKRFRIPAQVAPPPALASDSGTQRSVLGLVGRKLLKVLVYPLTDPVLGAVGEHFVGRWEDKNRPYAVRSFTPQDYQGAPAVRHTPDTLAALAAQGPALLFVHGTFSTSSAGFGALPSPTLDALHQRYGGRVFAFDHPSVSVDPEANVRWLLGQLPPGGIDLDIVCHSRGGLVSRVLAETPPAPGMDTARARVRRLVFGAAPNNGTVLADPDHMVAMVDRLTTLLALFPTGPVTETLEALVTVVKVIAHGALKGLDGLASMRPQGEFLGRVNAGTAAPADYFAIASNYSAIDTGLRGLVAGGTDLLLDTVFGEAGNDLVVPTEGVFQTNGSSRFPLDAGRVLLFEPREGVSHTTLFQNEKVSQRLLAWLA